MTALAVPLFTASNFTESSMMFMGTEPNRFTDQKEVGRNLGQPAGYLCGYVRVTVTVTRQPGVADTARIRLEGLGKDHDPWLAWGEAKIRVKDKWGGTWKDIKDLSKPSHNPHFKINKTEKEHLTLDQTITESGVYDLIGGVELEIIPGWWDHR